MGALKVTPRLSAGPDLAGGAGSGSAGVDGVGADFASDFRWRMTGDSGLFFREKVGRS